MNTPCEIEQIVREFDREWMAGSIPDIADYVHRLPVGHPRRFELLRFLIASDLEFSWKRDSKSARILEDYWRDWPELGHTDDVPCDLIETEWFARGAADPNLETAEYQRRFPQQWSDLANRLTRSTAKAVMVEPNSMIDLPGYAFECEIARGGMGIVYKAMHVALNRVVAVKMIISGKHAGQEQLARFRVEAEAAARLQHPNIVQIFEIGDHNGLPFFTLEFVNGGSLDKKLAGTPQNPHLAAKLMVVLAEAAHIAHQAGIVHRDLKPANVLLTSDGIPKIADFGLAKKIDSVDGQTNTGAILGTPSYMAPEQAKGAIKEIGPLADVYALGAILYEILTGRPPFKGVTAMDTLMLVLTEEPVSIRRLQPKTPVNLETICAKCLQKDPAKRYKSAQQLAEDLRRFIEGRPVVARPVGAIERSLRWVSRNPVVAILLLAVIVSISVGTVIGTLNYREARRQERNVLIKEENYRTENERADLAAEEALSQAKRADLAAHEATQSGIKAKGESTEKQFQLKRAEDSQHAKLMEDVQRAWATNDLLEANRLLGIVNPNHQDTWETRLLQNACRRKAIPLKGHRSYVTSLCMTSNGERVFSASYDRTIKSWDTATGLEIQTFRGHTDNVCSVVLSADGKRLVSGSWDKTAKVWNIATAKVVLTLTGHSHAVSRVQLSDDGKRIVSASFDKTVRIWDGETGRQLHVLTGHTKEVQSVDICADGSRVVSGGSDGALCVWDAESGKLIRTIHGKGRWTVFDVSLSQDGKKVVSAGTNIFGETDIWDAESGNLITSLPGHSKSVRHVKLSRNSQFILTGYDGGLIKGWDAETGKETFQVRALAENRNIQALGASGSGQAFASSGGGSVGNPGDVQIWKLNTTLETRVFSGHRDSIRSVALSRDGKRIVSAAAYPERQSEIKIWDAESGKELLSNRDQKGLITCVAFSADGKEVFSGGGEYTKRLFKFDYAPGEIVVRDAQTGQAKRTLRGHSGIVECIVLSPDGRCLYSGSSDQTIKVWDTQSGDEIQTLKGHQGTVKCLQVSSDGNRLFSGSWDKSVKIWDLTTGKEVLTLIGHTAMVSNISLGAGGRQLVSSGKTSEKSLGEVKVWDSQTGRKIVELPPTSFDHVILSPDCTRLFGCSYRENSIKVWATDNGQEMITLRGHTGPVRCLTLSPDSNKLYSAGWDNTIRVWSTK